MAKTLVDTYRGYDIYFDSEYVKFQCIVTEEDSKESKSFTAVKKFVDEYIKSNQKFEPFWATPIPSSTKNPSKRQIVGLRKDSRFIYVSEQDLDTKRQVSLWDESRYMIENPDNSELLSQYYSLDKELAEYTAKKRKEMEEVKGKLTITTLEEFKKSLLRE